MATKGWPHNRRDGQTHVYMCSVLVVSGPEADDERKLGLVVV